MPATPHGAACVNEAVFPPALHAELFEHFGFCLPESEQMLGYPVAGPDNDLRLGHRRYNFVWYRPASEERELPRLLTDDSGRTHTLSIPPPLIARDVIAAMRKAASQVLAPQFTTWSRSARSRSCSRSTISKSRAWRSAASRCSAMRRSSRVRTSAPASRRPRRMRSRSRTRCTRAPTLKPACGVSSPRACRIGQRIIERTRALGAYVQADLRTQAERDYAALHRTPEAVLAETAMMDY